MPLSRTESTTGSAGGGAWEEIPGLAELLAERKRLWGARAPGEAVALWKRGQESHCPSRSFACAALTEAGFAEVGSLWQELDDYILLAVR